MRPRPLASQYSPAKFSVGSGPACTVLRVEGELDAVTVDRLAAHLSRTLHTRPDAIVVDATRVSFCCASALKALVNASAEARSRSIDFTIASTQSALLRPVTALGLEHFLSFHPTVIEAMNMVHHNGSSLPGKPHGQRYRKGSMAVTHFSSR